MTQEQEQLEAQSREAIKAWCDDPSVQLELMLKDGSEWISKRTKLWFDLDAYYYRIAKPKNWYRVGRNKGEPPFIIYNEGEGFCESQRGFDRWLDERKYYD